jgi:SWI/SNF-related matrix-associated actin-dependent regulator of chromatin subfamily A3
MEVMDSTQSATQDLNLTQEEDLERDLFLIRSQVVGKRFYDGHMNDREMVFLVREPTNPYDSNAIRVLSLSQVQVGHISAKCGTARCLSKIVDRKIGNENGEGVGGRIEGLILSGSSNVYSSLAEITVIAAEQDRNAIRDHLDQCRIGYFDIMAGKASFNFSGAAHGSAYGASQLTTPAPQSSSSSSKSPAAPPANYQRLTEFEIIRNLDGIFEDQEEAVKSLTLCVDAYPSLARCFHTKLYSYQETGIAWLLSKEIFDDATTLPPFYKR